MQPKLINKSLVRLFILLSLSWLDAIGQDTLTGAIVEQKSLQLYQDKNWKELIKFGNSAGIAIAACLPGTNTEITHSQDKGARI